MLPENLPVLKGRSGKIFAYRLAQPLSLKQIEIFEKADRVFEALKPKATTLKGAETTSINKPTKRKQQAL
jgi:hypothetical protein